MLLFTINAFWRNQIRDNPFYIHVFCIHEIWLRRIRVIRKMWQLKRKQILSRILNIYMSYIYVIRTYLLYNFVLVSVVQWSDSAFSQFSRSVVSDSLRPHESQHAGPPCPSPTPRVHSDSHPLSQWCHPAISSSPPSSPSPPAPNPSQHQSLFQWVNSSHEVAKVLEFQL